MAGDGLARITLASTTSVSNNLALAGMGEWENSGVGLLKAFLYQFQTSVQLPMNFGVDGTGVDVTFYGDTSGVNMLWDWSADKLIGTNAKIDWYRDTTVANPGRLITIGDTHAGTLTASPTTFQVSATFNGAATTTSGVTGAEFKARHTTGNTRTVNQLRGLVGNADAKNGTVTTAYAVEGSVDVNGGTITTSACFHGNLNNSGTVTTSYGGFFEGVTGSTSLYLTRGVYTKYCAYGYYADNVTQGAYLSSDGGTLAADSSGVYMAHTATMIGGTSLYALNVLATPLGTGMSANAIYAKISGGSSKHITGWNAVAEFEYSCSGTQTPADTSCLQLVMDMDYTGSSTNSAYIMLRNYSSNASGILNFIRLYDTTPGTGDPATLFTAETTGNYSHGLRIMVGTTPYWIMCTSTAPS